MPGFPFPLNRDGSCSKMAGNECSIYASRPDICRTGFSRGASEPEPDYFRRCADACNMMQEADGMGTEWRVNMD